MLSTTVTRLAYNGTGANNTYSFPYYFKQSSDLKVYVDGVLKTLNTHYTVSGAGDSSGGSITGNFTSGTANLVIIRDPPIKQEVDLVDNSKLPAASLESGLDVMTTFDQRSRDLADRSFGLSDSYGPSFTSKITPEAGKVLGISSDGASLVHYALTSTPTAGDSITFSSNLNNTYPSTIQTRLRDEFSVIDFIPDSMRDSLKNGSLTTDVSGYIQNALNAIPKLTGGFTDGANAQGKLKFPAGLYKIKSGSSGIGLAMPASLHIDAMGAILDFSESSGLTLAIKYYLISQGYLTDLAYGEVHGLNLYGTGTSGIDCIKFGGSVSGSVAHEKIFRNCTITNFRRGVEPESDGYNVKFDNCLFKSNAYHIYIPTGVSNSAEQFELNSCTLANASTNAIYNEGSSLRVNMYGGSLDYNGAVSGGVTINQNGDSFFSAVNTHIETYAEQIIAKNSSASGNPIAHFSSCTFVKPDGGATYPMFDGTQTSIYVRSGEFRLAGSTNQAVFLKSQGIYNAEVSNIVPVFQSTNGVTTWIDSGSFPSNNPNAIFSYSGVTKQKKYKGNFGSVFEEQVINLSGTSASNLSVIDTLTGGVRGAFIVQIFSASNDGPSRAYSVLCRGDGNADGSAVITSLGSIAGKTTGETLTLAWPTSSNFMTLAKSGSGYNGNYVVCISGVGK